MLCSNAVAQVISLLQPSGNLLSAHLTLSVHLLNFQRNPLILGERYRIEWFEYSVLIDSVGSLHSNT